MFWQIFLFELKYRLNRPAFYVYFLFFVLAAFIGFGNGAVPVQEKEFYNAPAVLMLYSSMTSIFMMLASSSIMGVPLYRDIEHNTRDYYLSYPITKAGYFWGRFLGSFFFMLLIGSAIFWGAAAGCLAGPIFGWSGRSSFEPFHFYHYLHPYLTIVLPNLFFTSALFFGLVAVFRNVKVIYSSGIFLFLGYIIGNFFLQTTTNTTLIYLWDPFVFTGLRSTASGLSVDILNGAIIPIKGLLLGNRILWTSIGAAILALTYWRFSFRRFLGGESKVRTGKKDLAETAERSAGRMAGIGRARQLQFSGSYSRRVLYTLTRIEILNIVRDNYFWIILSGGLSFLGFLFWHGPRHDGVVDYPLTSFFMNVYSDNFGFFLFFLLMFYTGETVHRERLTRYAYINDALPPPNWVLACAKVLSLLALAVFLAFVPLLLGLPAQILQGFHHYQFPVYFTSIFLVSLPKLFEMVLFCYAVQVIVNNKFAGYGIGIAIWVLQFLGNELGYFTYLPLLYGNTPFVYVSDYDLAGHLLKAASWFNGYWLLAGSCLLVLAALFFHRGTPSSMRERLELVRERWRGRLRAISLVLLACFLAVGCYIYYNVSVVNVYLTRSERNERRALAEKQLKRYTVLAAPTITRLRLKADLDPEKQEEWTSAWITIKNNTTVPIDTILLDGDNLEHYSLAFGGQVLEYTCPLFFRRGKFNLLRPSRDSSDYRMYILAAPLEPGDTAVAEIHSLIGFRGFRNESFGFGLLHHMMAYNGGLPGWGYDDDEEIRNNDIRKENGLGPKIDPPIPHHDPEGMRHLDVSSTAGLMQMDVTVSTSADQWTMGPGRLDKDWREGGRHYFHYIADNPGMYPPLGILSAPYVRKQFDVPIGAGKKVRTTLYYFADHDANVDRLKAMATDGLQYMSANYGPYPFGDFGVAETSIYSGNTGNFTGCVFLSERIGWNAHFVRPDQTDFFYYKSAEMLAGQWWGYQVAPNHTAGSPVISSGLSKYMAMLLMEKKYGREKLAEIRRNEMQEYLWARQRNGQQEQKLLESEDGWSLRLKTGIVLYGLRDLIGEDSLTAALREFYDVYVFRNRASGANTAPSYAGSENLYGFLQKHVPDSVRYYLGDSWDKVCLYDNKLLEAKNAPVSTGGYDLSFKVSVGKVYIDSLKQERPATGMNDYIDIGVYSADGKQLYLKKWRLTAGGHTISLHLAEKPGAVAIDPRGLLIDGHPEDNRKNLVE